MSFLILQVLFVYLVDFIFLQVLRKLIQKTVATGPVIDAIELDYVIQRPLKKQIYASGLECFTEAG